jgi:transposase
MSRPQGTSEELERRRRRAVELVDGGEPVGVVSHMLGVHRSSVYRWRRASEAGPRALAARPHPHRPAALSDEQLRRLDQLLRQGAPAHGWTNDLWTTGRVAELISRHFRRCYHPDHVGRFLRERLGWSSQKPRRQARERNEEAILDWQSREFPQIARRAQDRGAHLVFLDESGFQLTPTVRKTWAPRGQTPLLKAWDRRDRISAISSLSVSPVARRINLHFDLLDDNRNVRSEDIVEYLRQLKATLSGPLTVLWDGSRVHRSKVVQEFLAQHPSIHTERLPAYAPELNPDELVWAWTKYSRLPNLAADNAGWLRDYLITEFHYLKRHPELLRSFIEKTHIPLRL